MYTDKVRKKRWILILLCAVLACVLLVYRGRQVSVENISEESASAIRTAIQNSALQCYCVEGAYPETLEYLVENYGLRVNTRDFYIRYEVYATNQPPQIKITPRHTE